jgi:hypothetical protein
MGKISFNCSRKNYSEDEWGELMSGSKPGFRGRLAGVHSSRSTSASRARPMILLLLTAALSSPAGTATLPDSIPTVAPLDGTLLGVRLRPGVAKLLREIETLFGRPVTAEVANLDDEEGGDSGRAIVSDNGTPTIRVDVRGHEGDQPFIEEVLAHELLHLRLRAKGYPTVMMTGDKQFMAEYGLHLQTVSNGLRNGLEHWLFAGEMQRMGFSEVSVIKTGRSKFGAAAREGRGDDLLLAIYLYRAILEYNDPSLLAELMRDYLAGHRPGLIKKSETLASVVTTRRPHTPEEVAGTLIQLHESMYNPAFSFIRLPDDVKPAGLVRLSRLHLRVGRRVD